MEVASNAIGDHEIGGDYDTTVQWLIIEQFSITENFAMYSDWYLLEQISIVEGFTCKVSQTFSEIISISEIYLQEKVIDNAVRLMSNAWEKVKNAMFKTKP